MKRLEIAFEDIATLMEGQDPYSENLPYLDLETGDVVIIPSELQDEEMLHEAESGGVPDWEKGLVPVAREIAAGSKRYAPLPEYSSSDGYRLMVEFAESVTDRQLAPLLGVALDGKGAFRQFKDVLLGHPQERERWFKFKSEALAEYIREWLERLGIEPVARKHPPRSD